jgi:nucleotide sugar dehydrogenase
MPDRMKIFGLEKGAIMEAFVVGGLTVAVYGLGKMGLPVATVFAETGTRVIGVDINQITVDEINKGRCPILGEPGLADMLESNVKRRRLSATTDGVMAAEESDIMIVIVPSLLDSENNPDLNAVTTACSSISKGLARGDFVIVETTVPPRTTKDVILPILKKSGLEKGDFGLAFCPERTSSGRAIRDITGAYAKVVGGIDRESTEVAEAIYSVINKRGVITVSDSTAAELVKLFEGIYRDVNIALSNELALICKEIGASPMEIFPVVNEPFDEKHQRYHVNLLQPGAGVGGHCIPVYPYFITKNVKSDTSLIKLARKTNDSMPYHMVDLIKEALKEMDLSLKDSNIYILGLAFRGGVKETRNSPTISIIRKLKEAQANVFLYDPLFSKEEIESFGVKYRESFDDIDCAVVLTDHKEFREYNWQQIGNRIRSKIVVDGRQVVDPMKVRGLGYIYKGIGYR